MIRNWVWIRVILFLPFFKSILLDIWLKTKSAVRVSLAKVMDKASEKLKCKYANGRAVVTYGLPVYKK